MRSMTIMVATLLVTAFGVHAAPQLGERPEDFTVKDIRFLPRTLADFGEQEAYILAFTSIEEEASRALLPELKTLEAELRGEPVFVTAVDVGNTQPIREVSAHMVKLQAGYHLLKDDSGAVARAFGVEGLPVVVILDSEKKIRYRGPWAGVTEELAAIRSGETLSADATDQPTGAPFPMRAVPEADEPITFAKHIAPIMHQHCYACHQRGESAPFSLASYNQVAARADMIAEVMVEERMPPWYASDAHGSWRNDRRTTQEERDLIVQWIRGGKQQGNMDDAPPLPPARGTEWQIGEPDLIIEATDSFTIPATGYIPYEYVTLPYEFPADTWVSGVEIMPSNPSVVHHANLAYASPGVGYEERFNFLTGRVPGNGPVDLEPPLGMFIPKGSFLTLQIHYVTTGTEQTDKMSVGIRYAEGPVLKRVYYKRLRPQEIVIPPHSPAAYLNSQGEIPVNATALALFTHMHLRGRDMTFHAAYPDGSEKTLLRIPNYNFDWQLVYEFHPGEVQLPKGTILKTESHYDNSFFNPFNPDPSDNVQYGDQTYEEMNDAYIFFIDNDELLDVIVDGDTGQAINQSVARAE